MNDFIPYLGFILALVFAFVAFITRKQILDVRALLSDAGTRSQQQRERLKQAENLVVNTQKQIVQANEQLKKLEKKSAETRLRQEQMEKELENARFQAHEQVQVIDRQLDHQKEQNEVLTQQLREAVREKKQIQEQALQLEKSLEKQSNALTKDLESKLAEAHENYKNLKLDQKRTFHKLTKLQELLKTVDPNDIKRLKARLSRSEQLYKSMKGLREMAEERNHNWETAIRLLASHIVKKPVTNHSDPIGPILGEALQKIGVSLEENVPDAFSHDHSEVPREVSTTKSKPVERSNKVDSISHPVMVNDRVSSQEANETSP